jgi:hypothetical protein
MMLDRSGGVRPVYGIAASVTLGDAAVSEVLGFGCGRERCLVKTATAVADGSQSAEAPVGDAVFGGDLVYFAETKQVARWSAGKLEPVAADVDEEVLSLRVAAGAVEFAVRREQGSAIVRVRLADGQRELVDLIPEATGPVFLLRDVVVFATADELVLRRRDGTEMRFPVAGAERMFAAGDGLVEIVAADGVYALRVGRGREVLFQLPEAPQ